MEEVIRFIELSKLLLDVNNPRIYKKMAKGTTQLNIAKDLYKDFGINDIKDSILKNGYFPVEPMVVVEDETESGKYVVVEGNRRLTTILILCCDKYREYIIEEVGDRANYIASDKIKKQLSKIPVVVAKNRDRITAYLGVRHITGLKKWDPLSQSKYVFEEIHKISKGKDLKEAIQEFITITSNKKSDVLNHFYRYSIYLNMCDIIGVEMNKYRIMNRFSLFEVALGKSGTSSVAKYMGINSYNTMDPNLYENIIDDDHIPKAKNVIDWIFSKDDFKIDESREITKYLKPILKSPKATEAFENGMSKEDSLFLANPPKEVFIKYLGQINKELGMLEGLWPDIEINDIEDLKKRFEFSVSKKLDSVKRTLGV